MSLRQVNSMSALH